MSRVPLRMRITMVTVGVVAAAIVLAILSGSINEIEESVAVGTLESSAEALSVTDDQLADYVHDLRVRLERHDGGSFDDWGDHPGLRRYVLTADGTATAFDPVGPVTLTQTLRCRASSMLTACESDSTGSASSMEPDLPEWAADLVTQRAEQVDEVPIVVHGFVAVDETGVATLIQSETDIFAASEQRLTAGVGLIVLVLAPLLLLGFGAMSWFLLGRVLRPVEAMRAQVDRIGAGSLDQRVPVPPADDELRHLAETMNRMLDRLERARESQRRFISDASHELRSPIAATGATLELANADPEGADWPEVAAVIEEENARLASLVDDLLLLARMDEDVSSGRQVPISTVDLDEVCLAEAARSRPLPVTVRISAPARIIGNVGSITRAIRNLVDNAVAHATSSVRIDVDVDGDDAVVRVVDDGPGVAPEYADRIFERFFRVDESRTRSAGAAAVSGRTSRVGGGAGLGLAIARQVVEQHGGTVAVVDSAVDGTSVSAAGATFEIRLPTRQ